MAAPVQIDFGAALTALVAGKSVARAAWNGDRSWTLKPEAADSDAMIVETAGNRKTGLSSILVTDLVATDWTELSATAA